MHLGKYTLTFHLLINKYLNVAQYSFGTKNGVKLCFSCGVIMLKPTRMCENNRNRSNKQWYRFKTGKNVHFM